MPRMFSPLTANCSLTPNLTSLLNGFNLFFIHHYSFCSVLYTQESVYASPECTESLHSSKTSLQHYRASLQNTKTSLLDCSASLLNIKTSLQHCRVSLQNIKASLLDIRASLQNTKTSLQHCCASLQGLKTSLQTLFSSLFGFAYNALVDPS